MTVHPGFSVVTGGTIERFLREIATRVDPERVVELHVFPPIQQGGIESGVAVIAAEQIVAQPSAPERVDEEATESSVVESEPNEALIGEHESIAASSEMLADESEMLADEHETVAEEGEAVPAASESIAADSEVVAAASESIATDSAVAAAAVSRAPDRLTIYTAHYRLVLKGPDRGKWDWGAVVDAEAPIEAVDAVVRGVQRRAGESFDAERIDGDAFRAALALASASTSAPGGTRPG